MPSLLIERLNAERRRYFVGHQWECEQFNAIINAAELPFSVLYLFGTGGVGKTTLLQAWIRICEDSQVHYTYLDTHVLEPSPDGFLNSLHSAMHLTAEEAPIQVLSSQLSRYVLLIDSYEILSPLDDWLREVFLPQLSTQVLVVLAGRCPPSSTWRADPGWQTLLYPIALQNLDREESEQYLTQRKIPVVQHQNILNFTQGHPLALSLIADTWTQGRPVDHFVQPEATSDVVRTLLEKFLEEVPSPVHRGGLEACAMVRLMTEALLSEMLDRPHVHKLFEWLRELSFVEIKTSGLSLNELARNILVTDLRWRNPSWYATLYQRIRTHYSHRLEQTPVYEQQEVLLDCLFLHRHHPAIQPYFTWQEETNLQTALFQETDRPALLQIVSKYEGEPAAQLASHWLTRQPQNVSVFRDAAQQIVGFVIMVALHQANLDDLKVDPTTSVTYHYLQRQAPLRSGEGAVLFRFWMARDTYQAVSITQGLMFLHMVQQCWNTPGIAFTFIACAEPNHWTDLFNYMDFAYITEANFAVGEKSYGIYGHDWRVIFPAAWRERLMQRKISPSTPLIESPRLTEFPLVFDQIEFVCAVQEALRHFTRPDLLYSNPLLRSRLVLEQAATHDNAKRIKVLQNCIREATQSLQSSPRDAKLYRALYRTYLSPAATQEQAAEALDLPFSTYRRHLKAGVTRVAGILWQWEVQGGAVETLVPQTIASR